MVNKPLPQDVQDVLNLIMQKAGDIQANLNLIGPSQRVQTMEAQKKLQECIMWISQAAVEHQNHLALQAQQAKETQAADIRQHNAAVDARKKYGAAH